MQLYSLEHLYEGQICDLYSSEQQMLDALPDLIQAAYHRELKAAFLARVEVAKGQKQRLDWILGAHGRRPNGHVCRGMRGVLEEGIAIIWEEGEREVIDAGIVAAMKRVDYYMMAGYLTALSLAATLGLSVEAEVLQDSLFTEESADDLLKDFSECRTVERQCEDQRSAWAT